MPPLPKRKLSKGKRGRRRSHDALHPIALIACRNCGEKCLPHHMCPNCGHYAGREVIEVKKA
jgi:large subunit ribosomal protein L32